MIWESTASERVTYRKLRKKMELLADLPDLHWEMVGGHIQSRKAKDVAKSFDRIHSLDSIKLADLLSKHRPDNLDLLEAYLEVNLAGEASKGGAF